jgi:CheY-like chemotaxis protein
VDDCFTHLKQGHMKKHILLIDDDEDEVTILIDALEQLNIPFKCTWAKNGEQAVSQLAYLTPDIIFLDVNMPGMNGFECLAVIKQVPRLQRIPVVLHSSVMSADYRARGIVLGASACLAKPDDISELAEKLRKLITAEATTMTG